MKLTFYGARGSVPVSGAEYARCGGDTTCFAVRTRSNDLLVFDAGTGIRRLGMEILRESARNALALEALVEFAFSGRFDLVHGHLDALQTSEAVKPYKPEIHLFFSHYHWDHIQGFPFFLPAYSGEYTLHIHGALKADGRLRDVLPGQMGGVRFPVAIDRMKAPRRYHEILEDTVRINDTLVTSRPLDHPQGCLGYRITSGECSIAIATDAEHAEDGPDDNLLALAEGADVLVYDAQYTPEEYEMKRRWGHSTWQEGVKAARAAGAKRLFLCHHDPSHDDAFLEETAARAGEEFSGAALALQGESIELFPNEPTPLPAEETFEAEAAGRPPAVNIRGAEAAVNCGRTFLSLAAPAFQDRLREILRYGVRTVRLLCPETVFHGSAGLVALADTANSCRGSGAVVRLEEIPPAVRSRLLAARFDTVTQLENDSSE